MGAWWDRLGLGQRVDKSEDTLPVSGATDGLFTIVGGRVLMTSIIGEVTVKIEGAANNTKLTATPGSGSPRDICAVRDTEDYDVGELLSITGIAANAMIPPTPGFGSVEGMTVAVVLKAGALAVYCAGALTGGKAKWTLHYIPIDDGAYVEVA